MSLLRFASLDPTAIDGMIISSVVPPINSALREMSQRYFGIEASSSRPIPIPVWLSVTIIRRRSAPTASSTAWRRSTNTAAHA